MRNGQTGFRCLIIAALFPRRIRLFDRRRFLAVCSAAGVGSTLLPGVLWAAAKEKDRIERQMIDDAALIADVPISDAQKDMMVQGLNDASKGYDEIYALHMPNSAAPALIFDPVLPGDNYETEQRPLRVSAAPAAWRSETPKNIEEVAFYSVRRLAELVRARKVSSLALTEMYLQRLKRYDPLLQFVIHTTDD